MLAAVSTAVLLAGYFTLCPRFGHDAATDGAQIALLALAGTERLDVLRVYVSHDHALVAWPSQDATRNEALFAKRFCRWRLVVRADNGFERETLRDNGVPARDANALYVRLMEGYAEGL